MSDSKQAARTRISALKVGQAREAVENLWKTEDPWARAMQSSPRDYALFWLCSPWEMEDLSERSFSRSGLRGVQHLTLLSKGLAKMTPELFAQAQALGPPPQPRHSRLHPPERHDKALIHALPQAEAAPGGASAKQRMDDWRTALLCAELKGCVERDWAYPDKIANTLGALSLHHGPLCFGLGWGNTLGASGMDILVEVARIYEKDAGAWLDKAQELGVLSIPQDAFGQGSKKRRDAAPEFPWLEILIPDPTPEALNKPSTHIHGQSAQWRMVELLLSRLGNAPEPERDQAHASALSRGFNLYARGWNMNSNISNDAMLKLRRVWEGLQGLIESCSPEVRESHPTWSAGVSATLIGMRNSIQEKHFIKLYERKALPLLAWARDPETLPPHLEELIALPSAAREVEQITQIASRYTIALAQVERERISEGLAKGAKRPRVASL